MIDVVVVPTGAPAVGRVGGVLVWGSVRADAAPAWAQTPTTQAPAWGNIPTTQTPGWTPVTN